MINYIIFIQDLDEVRIGLLKNISDFLSLVNKEARMAYLTQMVEFLTTDNARNWRFRLTLAYQMTKVITLYTAHEVSKHHIQIGKNRTLTLFQAEVKIDLFWA
jgi:hypothetical protein